MDAGIVSNKTFWDSVIFGKIQGKLGGSVRLVITGAAPIDHTIIEFLRIAVGCQVFEGYGQTETTATGCLTLHGDYGFKYGSHVGGIFVSHLTINSAVSDLRN
jgi:long-chain acyl-CoA synthetase